MFGKILIANRGEIACRVIRTARRMNIATVAVYSDADARAPHVTMADEAIRIGPAPASDSYLRGDLILEAAKRTGTEAIHPGYGFLSERADFAEACAAAGIAFIGPPAAAIAAMGDKIQSKKIAEAAGVNVVPGHPGPVSDTAEALRVAAAIGYPVMIKASAGGGGKGMRLAHDEAGVRDGFDATRREAAAAFGDDRVLIEKFIERPRHIEIQLLGDQHGNLVYLGERECSIQRRHQKVVEEAPSPFVTPAMRRAMGEQAIALARAVGYHSAGTVELIVSGGDPSGAGFYFLEMNTRLQVEHPVTEAITGVDLVEQMIRVAAGERLALTQDQVALNGWAIETRIYAEDPYRGFLPSTGRLIRYAPPAAGADPHGARIRIDDGVAEGSAITRFYDPMIAKLISWAPDRAGAIDAQARALEQFEIEGPATNIDLAAALMRHPRFRAGDLETGFIAQEYPGGFDGAPIDPVRRRALIALAVRLAAADLNGAGVRDWSVRIGSEDVAAAITGNAVTVEGGTLSIDPVAVPGSAIVRAMVNGDPLTAHVTRTPLGMVLRSGGARLDLRVLPARIATYADHLTNGDKDAGPPGIVAPMAGVVAQVMVRRGQHVQAGEPIAVIEAMKMENVVRADRAGIVATVMVTTGQNISADQVMIDFA
ncbi:acetyl-CoA carboxylase biotin carboxylase subunit [Sphingomonas sp.]|uniref:acetyl-CoA carboxylase biotin carboxylase subunit n=1 Tax=Sphingomonas sp. TaxID=28214 RepID=UPI0026195F26|nr:acetyl-CoA carboxylase biotin carboxylase subunit [Sphingomonas sp.]MDF2493957.1 acetyl/propionyl/methylcrotonyl-CoA carboxylase subunit alpha [Sphingomonas sp.]